jgi:hypothetical protein
MQEIPMKHRGKHILARNLLALAVTATLAGTAQVQAHHSAVAFDTSTEINMSGRVTKYSFRNPHIYLTIERQLENGATVETEVEAGAASVIGPLGFTRDAVQVGDFINVVGNPSKRDAQGLLLGRELYKEDGTYYPLNISSRAVTMQSDAVATSIAGTWFPPRTSFFGILGAVRNWPLTAKGQEYSAAMGDEPTPQKDCIPLGEPALQAYPVANVFTVYDDRVEMFIDWLDSNRTIWLDGREHPPASETFLHGHSVGHFDGNALVVDSTNFTFNPIGFSTLLASGEGKHLTERFELTADGKQMTYSGTAADPEYLTGTVEFSIMLEYRPEMQVSNESCNQEAAYKFLDD